MAFTGNPVKNKMVVIMVTGQVMVWVVNTFQDYYLPLDDPLTQQTSEYNKY